MEYSEEDLLPISALQHMVYCDRQAALIHIDQVWNDNAFTVEGTHLHRIVDEGKTDLRDGRRALRGISLRSSKLGLIGKSDVIELHPDDSGVLLPGQGDSRFSLVPVEYKRGRPKAHRADEVQLCAQAICLEEMLGAEIAFGALFYGAERRRTDVPFDKGLRDLTAEIAKSFREMMESRRVPVRERDARCERCSLEPVCMPPKPRQCKSAMAFLRAWVSEEVGGGVKS